jgi:hypothetical protein
MNVTVNINVSQPGHFELTKQLAPAPTEDRREAKEALSRAALNTSSAIAPGLARRTPA